MKVFFNSSITGKKVFEANYRQIFESIQKNGHQVLASPVFESSLAKIEQETVKEAGTYYEKLRNWIKQSDLCIFEVSYPSLSVGFEVAMALFLNKPVVALHVKGNLPIMLEAVTNEKLQVIEYVSEEADKVLKNAIAFALEQMDTRFNFFISPKLQSHLDWVSKTRRQPRAAYLRRLIENDMEKNEEYNQ